MSRSSTRILYVPNELGEFRQIGFRRPLADLLNAGLVEAVSVFSLLWRVQNGGDSEEHRQALVRRVEEFKPDVVIMQHLDNTGLREGHFRQLQRAGDFDLIYHEGDPYGRYLVHPLPSEARAAGRHANVVFTVGQGSFVDNFRRIGARDVRWAHSAFEPDRFRMPEHALEKERPHDIVIVANRNTPRLSFRGLPDWKARIKFVEYMQSRFVGRLVIYGRGWSGPGTMGPVPFAQQGEAIRSAWISANWDHFAREPKYFSNRLPISLASGSIHATTNHLGFEEIFPADAGFLQFGNSFEELADKIEFLLDTLSLEERVNLSSRSIDFANRRFRQDDQLVAFINYKAERISPSAARAAWNLDTPALDET